MGRLKEIEIAADFSWALHLLISYLCDSSDDLKHASFNEVLRNTLVRNVAILSRPDMLVEDAALEMGPLV